MKLMNALVSQDVSCVTYQGKSFKEFFELFADNRALLFGYLNSKGNSQTKINKE